jgi:ubiquinone/menaquinone biosynthesis C-methylase UbiE
MSEYDEIEYWNSRIKNFGSVNTSHDSIEGINQIENEVVLKHLSENNGIILDYGIGSGRFIPLYSHLKLCVQGYDIADFTNLINKKLDKHPLHYYHYIGKSAFKLDFTDNSFLNTVSFSVLQHIRPENIEKALLELKRVTVNKIICSVWEPDFKVVEAIANHNFIHDYKEIFKKIGLEIIEEKRIHSLATIYVLKK